MISFVNVWDIYNHQDNTFYWCIFCTYYSTYNIMHMQLNIVIDSCSSNRMCVCATNIKCKSKWSASRENEVFLQMCSSSTWLCRKTHCWMDSSCSSNISTDILQKCSIISFFNIGKKFEWLIDFNRWHDLVLRRVSLDL